MSKDSIPLWGLLIVITTFLTAYSFGILRAWASIVTMLIVIPLSIFLVVLIVLFAVYLIRKKNKEKN